MTMLKKLGPARYNHQTIALGFSLTEEAVEDNWMTDYQHVTQKL